MTWGTLESIVDPWSFLDYKKTFQNRLTIHHGMAVPNWAQEHGRRLTAYTILEDYYRTSARRWLNTQDEEVKEGRREYGDPYLVVEAVLSSIIGDEQNLQVDGYTDEQAALEQIGPPVEGAPPSENEVSGPATAVFDLITDWMQKERFLLKLNEAERKAIKLGDAVYVLGWSEQNERPRLRVYDPGFYFPVLDDWENDSDWPKRIHIAWEYEKNVGGRKRKFLRRITWEMRPTTTTTTLPWNSKPHTESCWMFEREWEIGNDENLNGDIDDLSNSTGTEIKPETDLEIDFIPVVHLPNTVAEDEHYGTSTLSPILQIIDDVQGCETDLAAASATTGTPPLSVRGTLGRNEEGKVTGYGPGQVFESENGAELLDTSRSLDALLKYQESLLDRMSVNGRIPNTLLGRIDPSKVPSGIVLTLSFQPHSNMVRHMRLVRQDKYDMLLRFVLRMFMQNGVVDEFVQPHLAFGAYLPADKQETSTIVWNLIANHAISLETGVSLLMQAGYPIDDIQREVIRIMSQNYEGAKTVAEASGDINASRAMLGLDPVPLDSIGQPVGGTPVEGEEVPGGTPFILPEEAAIPPAF
jgi:hypothetical protein